MEYGLTSYEHIYGILRLFINEPTICKYILNYKKQLEEIDTLEYHSKRWETIAGSHFMLRDSHEGKYSLIVNYETYLVKPDHRFTFYHLTGISYQIIDLIHELIKLKNIDALENSFINNYKEYLNYDDALYSELSKKIMVQMKSISYM